MKHSYRHPEYEPDYMRDPWEPELDTDNAKDFFLMLMCGVGCGVIVITLLLFCLALLL